MIVGGIFYLFAVALGPVRYGELWRGKFTITKYDVYVEVACGAVSFGLVWYGEVTITKYGIYVSVRFGRVR